MSIENILRLMPLKHRVTIVDFLNDELYGGVVETVPYDLRDLDVTGIVAAHDWYEDYDYLWIEVDQ